ncbi:hypothetical protein EDB84DRAFT_1676313 [Lactarius hengduanensis]|nr:hypothetical protein EDB84DRAFT_1676313 [Lactarius hengduanensis]
MDASVTAADTPMRSCAARRPAQPLAPLHTSDQRESNSYQISRVEGGTGENESEEDDETIETWNWGRKVRGGETSGERYREIRNKTWGQRNPDDRQMEATRQLQRDGDKGSATRAVWRWTKAIQGAETGIGRFRGERPSYLEYYLERGDSDAVFSPSWRVKGYVGSFPKGKWQTLAVAVSRRQGGSSDIDVTSGTPLSLCEYLLQEIYHLSVCLSGTVLAREQHIMDLHFLVQILDPSSPEVLHFRRGARVFGENEQRLGDLGSRGCEASQAVAQASAECELSYVGPRRSRTRRCRNAKAARECGEVGNGNGVVWSQVVGNVAHAPARRKTSYEWLPGSGTRWVRVSKAARECGVLGNARDERTSLSSKIRGKKSAIRNLRCKVVVTWATYCGMSGISERPSVHRARESVESRSKERRTAQGSGRVSCNWMGKTNGEK